MANVILTNRCNLQCPFCFATENQAEKDLSQFSLAEVRNIASFLDRKNKTFRYCGGEPTLNKDIIPITDWLLQNGYNIFLMTNGLWPRDFRDYMAAMSVDDISKFSFLFNVLSPDLYTEASYEKLNDTLSIINPCRATLGLTIYKKDFSYKYMVDLAKKYSISSVRLSISAPAPGSGRYYLEDDYYEIGERLLECIEELAENDIKVVKDCNYIPPCFFNESQRLTLKYEVEGNWNFSCASSPIDIDNEGNAWRCYGMYSLLKVQIRDFENELQLKRYFNRRMRIVSRNLYPYEECKRCRYWQKSCLGGCFTIRMGKALEANKGINFFPVDDEQDILDCAPQRGSDLVMRKRNGKGMLFCKKMMIENLDYNAEIFLTEIDGVRTISDLIMLWQANFDNYEEAKSYVVDMCRRLFEMDLIDINYDYKFEPGKRPARYMN